MFSKNYELKPLFVERMKKLLPDKKDFKNYLDILKIPPLKSIRCNTLKISPSDLKKRLEKKGWKISQPWKNYPEVMIVQGKLINNSQRNELIELEPGEIGRSFEHLLGYYYVQELASMLPIITFLVKEGEVFLDLCASPGSKTTQFASNMNNTGTIIANEISMGRLKILASNLERCGVTNCLITKQEGTVLCRKLKKQKISFDKILIDAPCSGEGTLRGTKKTAMMWNINTIKKLANTQKALLEKAIPLLKSNGELIYSTCTHAPEENEEVIDFILKKFPGLKIEKINLPLKTRQGILRWEDKKFDNNIRKTCRIYPQDNDTEGFFISKLKYNF